jgi:hypothetical protein
MGLWILWRHKEVSAQTSEDSKLRRGRALIQIRLRSLYYWRDHLSGSRGESVQELVTGVVSLRHALSRVVT